jgi:tRNA pseudouridine55 synthase
MKRGATGLAGILLIDKPAGMTSHAVVSVIRRASGERRIGHAGTLDPAATGLLVVLLGRCTRLVRYLSGTDKTYEARISFGTATDTDDADGHVVASAEVPAAVVESEFAESILRSMLGAGSQQPPTFSAIKLGGRVAHRAARAGTPLDLPAREVSVYSAELASIVTEPPAWDVVFRVSKGTFIRALARDIGVAAGTVAHLSALRRTTSGAATIAQAHSLDGLLEAAARGEITSLLSDPLPLLGMTAIEADLRDVAHGRELPREIAPASQVGEPVAVSAESRLLAVYRVEENRLAAETVIAGSGS